MAYEIVRFPYEGTVDADGHVYEPANLWEDYLEERYKDRAIRVKRDRDGWEYLEVDRRPIPDILGMKGLAFPMMGEKVAELDPNRLYMDTLPYGATDPQQRLDLARRENLEHVLLYPTWGLIWERAVTDPELSLAYMRAYNRWIADFCRDSGGVLVPIAHLTLTDPQGAAAELERAVRDGCKGAFVAQYTHTRVPHGHRVHDPVFAKAQELDVPLAVHVSIDPEGVSSPRFLRKDMTPQDLAQLAAGGLIGARHALEEALLSMYTSNTFDRYPKLKFGLLEVGASWVGAFLDRMDSVHEVEFGKVGDRPGMLGRLQHKPSEYFRNQCFISGDPEEFSATCMIDYVGNNCFMWATDYPHADHPATWVPSLKKYADRLKPETRKKVLGQNTKDIYHLA
jgi:predicted TIM-barrel fold metal-dependent hydrolase